MTLAELAARADASVLSAAAASRVRSEQWASKHFDDLEPYYFERSQYSRGVKLRAQPEVTSDAVLYGFDERGDVVRIRRWSGFLKRWHEDQYFVRDGEVVTVYRFDSRQRVMNVDRYTFSGERLQTHEMFAAQAKKTGMQTFVWEGERLVRVDVENWGSSWTLAWADGQLESIARVFDGAPSEVWRRPPPGESLEGLLPQIRELLLRLIPPRVAGERTSERAYGLAVVLDEESWNHLLPPSLALGFGAQREFNPAELTELHVDDAELTRLCARANQHLWQSGRYDEARAFSRALVKDLRALDWSTLRAVSDDFVVYFSTLEGEPELPLISASSTDN